MHKFRLAANIKHWVDIPPQFLQEVAQAYCLNRPLYRPNINILLFLAKWSSLFFLGGVLYSFPYLGVIPLPLQGYCTLSLLIIYAIISVKWFAIDMVKIYQHYAPAYIRRRCLLMPTCSEFAILSLRKYGFIIGTFLTLYRIFYRCRGTIYRIEYP